MQQVFPKDQPGIYINKLKLGPVKADLTAKYRYVGSDRIDVNFVDIAAYLGSLRLLHKVLFAVRHACGCCHFQTSLCCTALCDILKPNCAVCHVP